MKNITKNGFITKDGINYFVEVDHFYNTIFAFSYDNDLKDVELAFDYYDFKTSVEADMQGTSDEEFRELARREIHYWVADQYEKGNYQINIV